MSVSTFRDNLKSYLPAMHLLQNLGYQYHTQPWSPDHDNYRSPMLINWCLLYRQFIILNYENFLNPSISVGGSAFESALDYLMGLLLHIPRDGLQSTNAQALDLLMNGKSSQFVLGETTGNKKLQYIDWVNPENNLYHVVDQFMVERRDSHEFRRPGIVLFVNGIPLAVIECRRSEIQEPVQDGIKKQTQYQQLDEIPDLYVYTQILSALCPSAGKLGVTGISAECWLGWDEELDQDSEADLTRLINTPLSAEQKEEFFEGRHPSLVADMKRHLSVKDRVPTLQDRLLYSCFQPNRMLDLIKSGLVSVECRKND